MIANNLDMMNLAVFEREEALRRQSHAYIIGEHATVSPLRSLVARFFGALGGDPAKPERVESNPADTGARPASLTLMRLPAAVTDEARERAA